MVKDKTETKDKKKAKPKVKRSPIEKEMDSVLKNAEKRTKNAINSVPEKYHPYIHSLPMKEVIWNTESNDMKNKYPTIIEAYKGKTYCKVKIPYMGVDGRMVMLKDLHIEQGMRFFSSVDIFEYLNKQYYRVTIESKLYGRASGTKEIIFKGYNFKKKEHYDLPFAMEKAETSAYGRAVGFLGIGLLAGAGIASAEEVEQAIADAQLPVETNSGNNQSGNSNKSETKTKKPLLDKDGKFTAGQKIGKKFQDQTEDYLKLVLSFNGIDNKSRKQIEDFLNEPKPNSEETKEPENDNDVEPLLDEEGYYTYGNLAGSLYTDSTEKDLIDYLAYKGLDNKSRKVLSEFLSHIQESKQMKEPEPKSDEKSYKPDGTEEGNGNDLEDEFNTLFPDEEPEGDK